MLYLILQLFIFLQPPLLGTGAAGRIGDRAVRHVTMELKEELESVTTHHQVMAGNIVLAVQMTKSLVS